MRGVDEVGGVEEPVAVKESAREEEDRSGINVR
jgi:hypothetical protein